MADQTVPDGTLAAAAWYDNNVVVQALVAAAHERGVAAGRARAAAAIRDDPYPNPSPAVPAWHAGYVEATERAAVVAEGTEP